MAENPTIPAAPSKPVKSESALSSLVQIEKLIQLALLIPAATVIGWLGGAALDKLLHQHWLFLAGLLLGAAAGFIQMFRTVLQSTKD